MAVRSIRRKLTAPRANAPEAAPRDTAGGPERPIAMKCLATTAALALALSAGAAWASGPSPAGQREIRILFQHKIDEFFAFSKKLYFAADCSVIPRLFASTAKTDAFITLQRAWSIEIFESGLNSMMEELADIERFRGEQAGLAVAAQEGCGYWYEHPIEVFELRRQVGYEIAPAGPAPY
ncbi:MAG TPA: hypothetical protein VLZ74_09730 [Methylocella sp.]|nr:hypothetical protein [Methylocella sp.]